VFLALSPCASYISTVRKEGTDAFVSVQYCPEALTMYCNVVAIFHMVKASVGIIIIIFIVTKW
jgi:hypothetical protein